MTREKMEMQKAVYAERNRCLSILNIRPDEIRLMAGEMTEQEMRTVLAVLGGLKYRVQKG